MKMSGSIFDYIQLGLIASGGDPNGKGQKKGDHPSDKSSNQKVILPMVHNPDNVKQEDLAFSPMMHSPSAFSHMSFQGALDPGALVYFLKMPGESGGVILGQANDLVNYDKSSSGGGKDLLGHQFFQDLFDRETGINIPPEIKETQEDGVKVKAIKEKNKKHKHSLLKGLHSHNAIQSTTGYKLEEIKEVPTAKQHFDAIPTNDMMNQMPGDIASLSGMFQGLMGGMGGGGGGAGQGGGGAGNMAGNLSSNLNTNLTSELQNFSAKMPVDLGTDWEGLILLVVEGLILELQKLVDDLIKDPLMDLMLALEDLANIVADNIIAEIELIMGQLPIEVEAELRSIIIMVVMNLSEELQVLTGINVGNVAQGAGIGDALGQVRISGETPMDRIKKAVKPELFDAMNSLSVLTQGAAQAYTASFPVSGRVHTPTYLANAEELLSQVTSLEDLFVVLHRLQNDTDLFGIDQLEDTIVTIETAWGNANVHISLTGGIELLYANSNVQNTFVESMASPQSSPSAGNGGAGGGGGGGGGNMFGKSSKIMQDMMKRLPKNNQKESKTMHEKLNQEDESQKLWKFIEKTINGGNPLDPQHFN